MQVYKDIWKPSIGGKLACEREFDNCFDKFAIKVVRDGETVGHLPREFSKIAWNRFRLCFGVLGMIHGKLQIFFRGKWPTVSLLLTTLMANLSKQLSNSLSQARLSPMDGFQISLQTWNSAGSRGWKPRTAEEIAKICFANE